MTHQQLNNLQEFLDLIGLKEEPIGIFYTDNKPAEGFSPKTMDLPTREKEIKNEINWQIVFSQFSCVMGNIWRARKKKKAAYFSAEQSGCPGCAFWLGFMKPQTETIIHYVSTGIPGQMEGELYCESPDALRRIQTYIDPEPASCKFCVAKPLSLFLRQKHGPRFRKRLPAATKPGRGKRNDKISNKCRERARSKDGRIRLR